MTNQMTCHIKRLSAATAATILLTAGAQAQTAVTQWDQFAQAGITAAGPAMDKLIAKCTAESETNVLRTIAPSIGIRDSYRLAISAEKTPDLAYTWPAGSVLAGYARVGALAQLDEYYKSYGWNNLVSEFYQGRNSYQGHLYGLPMEQDLMGVYFNRDMFEDNGVAIPTTYAEFQAVAEKFKQKGIIPIAFGNRDRWPATNTMSLILGLTAGRAAEEEVLFEDKSWVNDKFKLAADTFRSWAEADYFPNGFNGIGYDEANALFLGGRAAMTMTGTWVLQDMARGAQNFDLGVFMLPPIANDVPAGTMWGEGSQWQISADADPEVKDAAAAYLACLLSQESRKTWVTEGYLVPIGTTVDELKAWNAQPIVQEFYSKGLATPETNFYDLHTTLPESVTQVLYPELQRLIGGDASSDEFLAAMQSAWETARTNNELWIP